MHDPPSCATLSGTSDWHPGASRCWVQSYRRHASGTQPMAASPVSGRADATLLAIGAVRRWLGANFRSFVALLVASLRHACRVSQHPSRGTGLRTVCPPVKPAVGCSPSCAGGITAVCVAGCSATPARPGARVLVHPAPLLCFSWAKASDVVPSATA